MREIKRNKLPAFINPLTYISLGLYYILFYFPVWYYIDSDNSSITIKTGLIAKQHEIIEMFRVKDIKYDDYFLGMNKITIITNNKTFEFKNVEDSEKVYKELLTLMRENRNNNNAKEII